MSLIIRPEAEDDIAEAYAWYVSKSKNLGEEFVKALETCFLDIQENPLAYPVVYTGFRRYLLRKFPYSIFIWLQKGCSKTVNLVKQLLCLPASMPNVTQKPCSVGSSKS